MRTNRHRSQALLATAALALALTLLAPATAHAAGTQSMWRLYNPYTGEHLYTASTGERNALTEIGWQPEGVGWIAPTSSQTPVYRLFNPYVDDHHYTTSVDECVALVDAGWRDEGICWYSDDAKTVEIKRQFNPYEQRGTHNYTYSQDEASALVSQGWHDEGTAWYAVARGDVTVTTSSGITVGGPEGFTSNAAFQRVEQAISSVKAAGRDIGVVMYDLHSGRSLSYNANKSFYSASTAKALYCAMILESYGSAGANTSLVEASLVNSDNAAYGRLVDIYGRPQFDRWLAANGAPSAYHPSVALDYLYISAGETANAWEHIWNWWLSGGAGSSEFAGYMRRTHHSAMGGLLRKRYEAWCKPGWYPDSRLGINATNDVGIVFSDCGPYVLVVMTNYGNNFQPLFSIIDSLNSCHGALCGGSTESLLTGYETRS